MEVKSKSLFSRMNPFVNFIYFFVVVLFTVIYLHPFVLITNCIITFCYLVYLDGKKRVCHNLKLSILIIITGILNPLFNHEGMTVLFYLNQNPITKESVIYGFVYGLMVYTVLLEFAVFNKIMSSDKIICILSKTIPVFALLFTIALRFVPLYKGQLKKMKLSLKGVGYDSSQGNIIVRIIHGAEILSGLVTWALENALETAGSMKSRGFGLKGRSYYNNTKMTKFDKQVLGIQFVFVVFLLIGICLNCFRSWYFPEIRIFYQSGYYLIFYFVFILFVSLPFILDIREELLWHLSKQRI